MQLYYFAVLILLIPILYFINLYYKTKLDDHKNLPFKIIFNFKSYQYFSVIFAKTPEEAKRKFNKTVAKKYKGAKIENIIWSIDPKK